MPSRKILATVIVCASAILSVFLLQKQSENTLSVKDKTSPEPTVSTYRYDNVVTGTSTDWKKILTTLDTKSIDFQDLTKNSTTDYDKTTLTAQMSRDFMSQYLLLKKGGRTLTTEDLNKISANIINSPQYTEIAGAVYLPKNLKISQNNDDASLKKYKNAINLIIQKRSAEVNESPIAILNSVSKSNDPVMLNRLNVIIKSANGFIQDFLDLEVPSKAVGVHLNLMNSVSGVMSTSEAMKEIYNDPVKAMVGLSQYNFYINLFQKRLSEMNTYLQKIN